MVVLCIYIHTHTHTYTHNMGLRRWSSCAIIMEKWKDSLHIRSHYCNRINIVLKLYYEINTLLHNILLRKWSSCVIYIYIYISTYIYIYMYDHIWTVYDHIWTIYEYIWCMKACIMSDKTQFPSHACQGVWGAKPSDEVGGFGAPQAPQWLTPPDLLSCH